METEVNEVLNEYFRLKYDYEFNIMSRKKIIINKTTLSNREKRAQFKKLKHNCIICRRPGGCVFKTTYFPEDEKSISYRLLSAVCVCVPPCNFNIKLEIGETEQLPHMLNNIQEKMKNDKSIIINEKNKLLFGNTNTEAALEKFSDIKDSINHYSSLYEIYLDLYNNIIENKEKKQLFDELMQQLYTDISKIKEYIKLMNIEDNSQLAKDAVSIYVNSMIPLLEKIREIKYDETKVIHEDSTNTCNLLQNKYSIANLSFTNFENKVVSFNLDSETNKKVPKDIQQSKKKILVVQPEQKIEIVSESEENMPDVELEKVSPSELQEVSDIEELLPDFAITQ